MSMIVECGRSNREHERVHVSRLLPDPLITRARLCAFRLAMGCAALPLCGKACRSDHLAEDPRIVNGGTHKLRNYLRKGSVNDCIPLRIALTRRSSFGPAC